MYVVRWIKIGFCLIFWCSNTAAREISNYALSHLQAGGTREEITLQSMEPLIEQSSFSSAGKVKWFLKNTLLFVAQLLEIVFLNCGTKFVEGTFQLLKIYVWKFMFENYP